jgi:hypothetical protein
VRTSDVPWQGSYIYDAATIRPGMMTNRPGTEGRSAAVSRACLCLPPAPLRARWTSYGSLRPSASPTTILADQGATENVRQDLQNAMNGDCDAQFGAYVVCQATELGNS